MTEEEEMRERLIGLAERCEAATGTDRELDRDIELTLPGVELHPDGRRFDNDLGHREPYVISGVGHPDYEPGQGYIPSRYTASIDLAMSLVPEGWHWSLYDTNGFDKANAQVEPPEYSFAPFNADGATPALALCAAAIRARASNPLPIEKE